MRNGVRIQITLTKNSAQKLDALSKQNDLSRSAIVAYAVAQLYREEEDRDEK